MRARGEKKQETNLALGEGDVEGLAVQHLVRLVDGAVGLLGSAKADEAKAAAHALTETTAEQREKKR